MLVAAGIAVSKGINIAEVIVERRTAGMPVTPAPGPLKEGGKDEERLRGVPILWVLESFARLIFAITLQ